ncbi:NAD-dependent epimerase/dehydratase family protein [Methylobacterium haplocladii]|uniref:GDP-6-deoxy-D-lyxo-4-hexulose reductase n=1 Tax=Methylobacterium haplocladii TaxID=1176176 RepID=A0A512IJG1_9HYPH|nr:NAD-dependent epimerase/dehydratase family protein [Methylobacterium haplocladii]GEO97824.1 GDP-6-deoxy-D-lyxo-4-hexulose reductase [Methylobacterium haplocladii]GJD82670.1 GDP-6-deoxy-D-mannose reductase [Methylobacterium haplocladii]GLS57543.1 GDP-6-deoxy-D-lyxo-4-hexulose reductase [Methylobacterium haplocladii]
MVTRILITGVGGFVGRHALRALAGARAPGDAIAGLGLHVPENAPEGVSLAAIDLLDGATLSRFFAAFAPTHVLHLAGLSSVGQAGGAPAETWRVNLLGVLNVAEAMVAGAPGSTFLFASSGEVYGRAFLAGEALDETVVPQPANTYARTKLAAEGLLADVLPAAGIRLVTLRPFNHIGPGQDERFVVPSFAGQIARIEAGLSEPVLDVGDLTARRDFLDVGDVVAAYAAVIRGSDSLEPRSVFNVGSGRARPISDLLNGLREQARVPFEIRVAADRLRPSEIPTASGDASALTRATGWKPRIALAESLTRILDDARARVRP